MSAHCSGTYLYSNCVKPGISIVELVSGMVICFLGIFITMLNELEKFLNLLVDILHASVLFAKIFLADTIP